MIRRHLLALLAVLLVASPLPAEVRVDFDPDVTFGAYRTFTWMEGTPARDAENDRRIHEAVRRELADRDILLDEKDPDLIVVTHAALGGPWSLPAENFRYGGYPQEGWNIIDNGVQAVVIVDILLADSKRLVWRGLATEKGLGDAAKLARRIDKVIHKMFKRFPD